ncbi:NAD(P)-dependent dehydrogenase, short-chain alcohol dehydrogenase family [Proteiniborus ethanoligenes]|uniref:NAD(P)-dependent dehydrogenase, short-chain alcohol dehydrogenase family n=1 Tax=Proteiniborus ethanoligenes TaxID=415015 RepID=A0A1H3QG74_9FIRM|nr:SDR family NAD(P)-dependent oxidoreductase [Proteiniborus ethanoligenes]SDZ12015.1 NAD(P)-dependent dehydrogenase, short-chain alcohol dehydrogenase family [Proteiniborus ethanoligenes]
MKLKDKVAIVTGASAGMGRDIAYLFAKEGATVYAIARRVERLEELAKSVAGFEGKVIPFGADLMNKEEAEKIIDFAYENSGRLDILVNNAGIMDDFSPIGDVQDDMLEKVFNLNVYAPFYSMRKAIKIFLEAGEGNIINVSSIGGLYGARAGAAYTASKHALIGLTKNTGYMYAKKNIRCNAICPGGVETEIGTGDFMKNVNQEGIGIIMANVGGNPRNGTGMEIATIALFLASEDSSFVNGQCIVADSGWTAF